MTRFHQAPAADMLQLMPRMPDAPAIWRAVPQAVPQFDGPDADTAQDVLQQAASFAPRSRPANGSRSCA